MNNKKIGNEFEEEFCEMLRKRGFWVHFIVPDKRGAQPFDVLAVRRNIPYAFDCKTSSKKYFKMNRLEDNQIMAFEKWLSVGNGTPFIAVKYKEEVYLIPYVEFRDVHDGKVDLEKSAVYRWK